MAPEGINPNQEKKRVVKFKTEKGSVYTYLPDGRIQRFKTATGALSKPKDVIVFVPPWNLVMDQAKKLYPEVFGVIGDEREYDGLLLRYVHAPAYTIHIIDGEGVELLNPSQIAAAPKVFLAFSDRSKPGSTFTIPVAKEPKIGYSTYDTARFEEDGTMLESKHLGNKVVEIEYEK